VGQLCALGVLGARDSHLSTARVRPNLRKPRKILKHSHAKRRKPERSLLRSWFMFQEIRAFPEKANFPATDGPPSLCFTVDSGYTRVIWSLVFSITSTGTIFP
jgi:hypothetical protein